MIQIHRSQPIIFLGNRRVSLSSDEYRLIITLGMMDNRLAPHDVLLEAMCEERRPVPGDQKNLYIKIARLRKKLGGGVLRSRRHHGYILAGQVEFVE